MKIDGDWYRLKGCGDLYDGFPVMPLDDSPDKNNIRGCTFEHTSSRELHMNNVIAEALKPFGVPACNASVGTALSPSC